MEKPIVTLTNFKKGDLRYFAPGSQGFGLWTESTLVNLAEGNHTLKAYSLDVEGRVMSTAETFTVDTTFRYPTISIVSPLNQSYSKNEVPLTYTIDAQVQWAYYIIDYFGGKSFSGNITLPELPEGSHRIEVSALTEWGYATQVTYFNIDTTQTDNPLTIQNQISTTVIATIAIITVVVVLVILYRRKKAKETNK